MLSATHDLAMRNAYRNHLRHASKVYVHCIFAVLQIKTPLSFDESSSYALSLLKRGVGVSYRKIITPLSFDESSLYAFSSLKRGVGGELQKDHNASIF